MAPQVVIQTNPEPANEPEILREQLEYLIGHTAANAQCACSECQRFLRARSILLEIFAEPAPSNVQPIGPRFAKAA